MILVMHFLQMVQCQMVQGANRRGCPSAFGARQLGHCFCCFASVLCCFHCTTYTLFLCRNLCSVFWCCR